MLIGMKNLKEYEGKEVQVIDFILDIDGANNLINFAFNQDDGIAVIETIQTDKKNTVIVFNFNEINKEVIKINAVFETEKRH